MNKLALFYGSSNYYQSDDGLRLHYRDIGKDNGKYTILCLPGLTRNSRDFEELASHLAADNRVIAPDLRGRGLSEPDTNWRNYHPATYAKDIWMLLDSLSIDKVVIIGTSLGGLIAMLMTFQNSSRISGVVLNDIGPEIDPKGLKRIKEYTGHLPAVDNWQQASEQTKEVYGPWLPGLNDSDWMVLAKRAYRENSQKRPVLDIDTNIGKAIREVGALKEDPWQLFDSLEKINTLVLRGELSDILTDEILSKMHARKNDLLSAVIPDRGHVPLLDENTSVTAIENFLQAIKP